MSQTIQNLTLFGGYYKSRMNTFINKDSISLTVIQRSNGKYLN